MSSVLSFLSTVFWGVLVLSVLVFLHEGGHYLAARALKVRATEFFLGMPCRIKASRKSAKVGTEFGVTPLLLGGYTKICGMEGGADALLAPALALVMEHGRISAADVATELGIDEERAYGILATLTDWASIRPYYNPELGENPSQKTWPAAFETLERDASLLTEYDRGHDFSAAGTTPAGAPRPLEMGADEFLALERRRTYAGSGFLARVAMLIAGPVVNIVLAFLIVTCALMVRGVDFVPNVTTLGSVEEGSYAAEAGLEAGDTVTAVDGEEVSTWTALVEALQEPLAQGRDLTLTYERDGAEKTVTVDLPDGEKVERIGIVASTTTYHPSFTEAAASAVSYAGQVGSYVVQLIQPQHTMEVLEQSSSVVGISVMASEAAANGLYDLALIVAAISMSLGFMNLLPIPPLDGGKILIEVIQAVIRRPLPMRVQTAVSYVGLAFFVFVFVFVLRNDISRILMG